MKKIIDIINSGEGIDIEFKRCGNKLPKTFWETYSAFANTNGGVIILGYDEKSNNIIGIEEPEKIILDLVTMANDKQKTNFNMLTYHHIQIYEVNHKKIIKVTIDEASYTRKPIFINGDINNTFIRRNSADIRVTKDDLKELLSGSIEETDGDVLKNFDINDMCSATIENYREYLVEKTGNLDYFNMNLENFLINIGAYRLDRTGTREYKPTKGALLLFGKYNSIIEVFPNFQLDYFEKVNSEERWNDRVSTGDMAFQTVNNIFDFYNIVIRKIYDTTVDRFILDERTQQRRPFKKDLQESIREAVVNSLMHAYYDGNIPVRITVFKDYYEFENPGRMRVTLEEFISGKTSKIRNHVIATLLRKVGISEKAASGGLKIYKTSEKYKLKSPEVHRGLDKTIVRIWEVDVSHSFKDLPEIEQLVMNLAVSEGYITKNNIIVELGLTAQQARGVLERLVKGEYLLKVGKSRATKYMLPMDSQEHYIRVKKILKNIEDVIDNR